jgi:hypothetical protein
MGALRAAKGHPKPYNVTYWCIGNEPDNTGKVFSFRPWGDLTLYRHFGIPFEQWNMHDSVYASPGDVASLTGTYCDSMRSRSPIPIQIGGIALGSADSYSWLRPVVMQNSRKIDWIDDHYYPCWGMNSDSSSYCNCLAGLDTGHMLTGGKSFEEYYKTLCDTVAAYSAGKHIPVNIFEYNSGPISSYDPFWWYLDGLFIADALGHFMMAGVPMAGVYSIFDEEDNPELGLIRGDTLSIRAGAWVLKAYNAFFGDTLIKATSNTFGLNAYSSLKDNDSLIIFVINKNLDSNYSTNIKLNGFISNGTMEVWDITKDTILEAPFNGTKGIVYQGNFSGDSTVFAYTFAKASVTVLKITSKYPTHINTTKDVAPSSFVLSKNYPNPFNPITVIRYTVPQETFMSINIFDIRGSLVRNLLNNETKREGTYTIQWDGKDNKGRMLGSGKYYYKVISGDRITQNKMILLK